MARKRTGVKKSKHTKGNDVLVALSDRDFADLTKAAAKLTEEKGEQVGRATVLRELAMPLVREMLAPAAERVAA